LTNYDINDTLTVALAILGLIFVGSITGKTSEIWNFLWSYGLFGFIVFSVLLFVLIAIFTYLILNILLFISDKLWDVLRLLWGMPRRLFEHEIERYVDRKKIDIDSNKKGVKKYLMNDFSDNEQSILLKLSSWENEPKSFRKNMCHDTIMYLSKETDIVLDETIEAVSKLFDKGAVDISPPLSPTSRVRINKEFAIRNNNLNSLFFRE